MSVNKQQLSSTTIVHLNSNCIHCHFINMETNTPEEKEHTVMNNVKNDVCRCEI